MIPPHGKAEFVAAMEQVLDAYRRSCDVDCPVVYMDETPRQLTGETRAPLPMVAGRPNDWTMSIVVWEHATYSWRTNR